MNATLPHKDIVREYNQKDAEFTLRWWRAQEKQRRREMIQHKKEFGVYHWDTFDNTTLLVGEADTLAEAKKIVKAKYRGRISPNGADQVDIVDGKGNIVEKFSVG